MRAHLDDWPDSAHPFRFADLPHRGLPLHGVEPVNEENAVQMISLVLDRSSQELRAFDHHGFAMLVPTLGDHAQGSGSVKSETREGKTPLRSVLTLLRQIQARVNEVADNAVDKIGEHAQAHTDLRGGQAGSRSVEHGVGEVLDELAQLPVEVDDRNRRSPQNGIAEQANVLDRHEHP